MLSPRGNMERVGIVCKADVVLLHGNFEVGNAVLPELLKLGG